MKYVVGVGASGALAEARVAEGVAALREHPALRVLAASRAYANPAFGGVTHERFVNAAAVVDTALGAAALLHALHAVEARVGRVRGTRNSARALDLDVLWALDAAAVIALPTALVPHPRLLERPSATVPAVEALARARLPVPFALAGAARGAARATLVALAPPW